MKNSIFKFLIVSVIIASMMLFGSLTAFAADVDVTEDIGAAGDYKLTSNISGTVELSSGTYQIDLNGFTWTGILKIKGATVTITDSAKDGVITTADNDVIMLESGALTVTGIKIEGNDSGCDGIFVSGGKATINDCTISALSSAVQNKGGEVTINGGTYSSGNNALKVNGNSMITVNGAELNGDLYIGDDNAAYDTIEKAFVAGSGYKLVISEKSEDGTKITKASFVKENEEVPSTPKPSTPTPSNPDKQPSTGDAGSIILLAFASFAAMVALKKKKEA